VPSPHGLKRCAPPQSVGKRFSAKGPKLAPEATSARSSTRSTIAEQIGPPD
jgi:hypothetical protein